MIATLALAILATAPAVFAAAIGDELLKNPALEIASGKDWPADWGRHGNATTARVVALPGQYHENKPVAALVFSAQNTGASQHVAIDPAWRTLEMRFRMKTETVVRGKADWQNARMALRWTDENRKTVTPWPNNTGRDGTSDWQDYTVRLTVPERARHLVVEPSLFGASGGTVWFSHLSLRLTSLWPAGKDAPNPLGDNTDAWAFDAAWKTRSTHRERVSLNGYWQIYPVFDKPLEDAATADKIPGDGTGWGIAKVPGYWIASDKPQRTEQPLLFTPQIEKKIAAANLKREDFRQAWYRRRLDIPATWIGRRITLTMTNVNGTAEAYIDGQKAGALGWPGGELDLTKHCAAGKSHTLALLVSDKLSIENPFAPPAWLKKLAKGETPEMKHRGLCGDAFLDATPGPGQTPARLGPPLVRTSVRDGKIGFQIPFVTTTENNAGDAALADLLLRAEISDTNGRAVKTIATAAGALLAAKPFADAAHANERIAHIDGEWKPGAKDGPALWDTETPNLYTAKIALVRRDAKNAKEQILDETLPIRFGFRELRIEGRHLLLNETRITLRSFLARNISRPASAYMASAPVCRDTIAGIKNLGGNFAMTDDYYSAPGDTGYADNLYNAADEAGILTSLVIPHGSQYEYELDKPDVRARWARATRHLIERHGNHPAIILYAANANSMVYQDDLNPLKIDGKFTPVDDLVTYMDKTEKKGLAEKRWQAFNVQKPLAAQFDPTREIYHHSAGNAGAILTHNDYLNWAPPQERAEWHAHWAAEGVKPVFIVEYGIPFIASFMNYRGPSFIFDPRAANHPKWWYGNQYAASFLNQRPYTSPAPRAVETLREALQKMDAGNFRGWWNLARTEANYHDVVALFAKHYLPAFRAWGVSWQPWDVDEVFRFNTNTNTNTSARRQFRDGDLETGTPPKITLAELTAPGIRHDFHGTHSRAFHDPAANIGAIWQDTAASREIRRWNQPRIAFIAGPADANDPAAFTDRARNHQPGAVLEKQLILINETNRATSCRYEWKLDGTDEGGGGEAHIPPGQQLRIPISMTLPRGLPEGARRLTAGFDFTDAKTTTPQTQTDEFLFNVLSSSPPLPPPPPAPSPVPPKRAAAIVLFDPAGDTAQTLSRLGIAHTRHTRPDALPAADTLLANDALLVIGRRALDANMKLPQIEAVTRGLNILVFEQTQDTLRKIAGFRTQTLKTRNAFIRAPGHPALRGIRDEHLADWQGKSSLIDEYDNARDPKNDPPHEDWCGFRNARVWRGGNRGAIATVLIEKPAIGDFLPLVDCGFDLQYSPLLEWRPGSGARQSSGSTATATVTVFPRGRMILCQLDITRRTRPDPVADRLTLNLVASLQNEPAPTPGPRPLFYAGDANGEHLLASLGFDAVPLPPSPPPFPPDAVLVLGSGAPEIRDLDATVNAGLRVLALALTKDDLLRQFPAMFDKNALVERELFPSPLEDRALAVPEFAGISNAETHWFALPELAALPVATAPDALGNEALQRVIAGRGAILFSQAAPWMFSDEKVWQRSTRRRALYLVSRLLHNLGASARHTGSLEKLLAGGDNSRPAPWLKTHYLQTPQKYDDPYIFWRW
ncbi:MAG: hypothetical protein LBK99_14630 [Opitutaceae bacterium]|jgi:hypothetical protein|nr:hypothetical protein [Opitutaceae bacterium]